MTTHCSHSYWHQTDELITARLSILNFRRWTPKLQWSDGQLFGLVRCCFGRFAKYWYSLTFTYTGEQLESVDRLRQRASEAHDLILYYNEFALGDTSRLESMRKDGGREGRAKVAVAARRLMSLAREVDGVEGADTVSSSEVLIETCTSLKLVCRHEIPSRSIANASRRTC